MDCLILDHFGDCKTRLLTCPTCGWKGTFDQDATDSDDWVQECCCPSDTHSPLERPLLAVIGHPTLDECRAHFNSLSCVEKGYVEAVEISLDRFNRLKLNFASQLPDVPDPVLDLLWDQVGDDVVICLGEREIWREPVRYEALWRYEELLALLKGKYEPRLRDLEPTEASKYHLYGDKVGYAYAIDSIREKLQKTWTGVSGQPKALSG